MTARIGVDVGGTFTDIVLMDMDNGAFASTKVPTDYADPVRAIVAGLEAIRNGHTVEALHHATTLATNAVIEGKLPPGLLLTTRGFRDVIDIGRIQRPEAGIYDFTIDNPLPLIPRDRRLEVDERIGADGSVVEALDEGALRAALRAIPDAQHLHACAIVGLFSFVNPAHEARIGEIVREELPHLHLSLSHRVSPEIREFERSSTTVLDALLKPILAPYLGRLDQRLAEEAVDHVRIMLASGGLAASASAADKPVQMINSGPSAGVLAAASLGRALGLPDLITIDMGGTSLDIGVVRGGQPVFKFEGSIEGYPIRMPVIDVAAVAAGGGSLALIDAIGMIQVDRESAGSEPGPACYGRGGTRPTITDADVVLGRLGTDFGTFRLDAEAAEQAFATAFAGPLEVDVETAAASVLDIIQARMAKAIAANTLEKGIDLRDLPLVVYGGAGPTHGAELAEALGMRHVIVPYLAGNFSAVGLLLSAIRADESRMILAPLASLTPESLGGQIAELVADARLKFAAAGLDRSLGRTGWLAHMRYSGQAYDLAVDLGEAWDGSALAPDTLERLAERFHALHEERYAYRSEREVVECVQLRVFMEGPAAPFPTPASPPGPPRETGTRPIYFTGARARLDTRIWDRASLPAGTVLNGPALIEGTGSSTIIPPGWTVEVDDRLDLILRPNAT